MATIREWEAGVGDDGRPLRRSMVNKYRARAGLEPLENVPHIGADLNKMRADIQKNHPAGRDPGYGPGSELSALLASIGLTARDGCGCEGRIKTMNGWGVDLCRRNRAKIRGWLEAAQERTGWLTKLRAGWGALATGLVFQIDRKDPLGWLVDESIRRAELKGCANDDC